MQLYFNIAALSLLIITIVALLTSGYSGVLLNTFSFNGFSLFFALIFTAGLLLINLISFSFSENYQDFALVSLFSLLGMYVVASSVSLITIFLGLELSTMPMVFAILFSRKGTEAAAKLLIMSAIAIAVLSFSIVLLFSSTNSLGLKSYSQGGIMAFAAILFIASIGFEASIFPFNVLIPDVYTGAQAYVTGMLGGVNKKVGFAALMQVLILVFISNRELFMLVAALSVLTMFYGNIVALMQKNTKRMLAYSSISQAGYILIGIAVATSSGAAASMFQIFAHMFIFIGMLAIVAILERRNRNGIDDLIGLNGENRYLAFAMTLFMLSLIGLPLTTGFVGKFLIFLSAVNAGFVWLAIIGILNSVISILYYARAIMAMYTVKEGARSIHVEPQLMIAIFICIGITLAFGIYPAPLLSFTGNAAAYLFH